MSDLTIQAQQARHQLAQALGALQQEGLPEQLEVVAGLVAQAMSLLHRVETRGETGATSSAALDVVREALKVLQTHAIAHPAADVALEQVAGSLGLVHKLNQALQTAPAPKAPTPAAVGGVSTGINAPARAPTGMNAPARAPAGMNAPAHAPAPQAAPPSAAVDDGVMGRLSVEAAAPTGGAAVPGDPVVPHRTTPASGVDEAPIPLTNPTPSVSAQADRKSLAPVTLPSLPPEEGELFADAALGAYSTTNFFKGLSGNDVVDAGGLFIATYDIPELGQRVRVHVTMPGGFEFEARGTVAWSREMPQTGSLNPMSPPGYGVRFTEISPEARRLIYRYVRNREPLFYDDL